MCQIIVFVCLTVMFFSGASDFPFPLNCTFSHPQDCTSCKQLYFRGCYTVSVYRVISPCSDWSLEQTELRPVPEKTQFGQKASYAPFNALHTIHAVHVHKIQRKGSLSVKNIFKSRTPVCRDCMEAWSGH